MPESPDAKVKSVPSARSSPPKPVEGPGEVPPKLARSASEGGCDRCGAEMFRMHAVWRCPRCGFKTDCCGW